MKRKIFFGWWVALACSLVMFARGGIVYYSFSVFLKELTQAFGWSRSQVSAGLTIQVVMLALMSPVVGRLSDRRGPRQVMLLGCLVLGACYLALFWLNALWQFYLLYLVIGIGHAMGGQVPVGVAISNWFSRYRGRAVGTTAIGMGLGGLVGVPLAERLIAGLGWRWAYLDLGLLLWALTLPAVAFLMRNRPEEMGLLPDGATPAPTGNSPLRPEGALQGGDEKKPPARPTDGLTRAEALRSSGFWLLAFAFFLIGLASFAVMIHQMPFLTDKSFSKQMAAFIMGLTVGGSILARVGFGLLADRVSTRAATVLDYLLVATGIPLLLVANSPWMLYLFAVVMGLGIGGIVVLMTLMTREWFGPAAYGEIFGYLTLAFMAGAGLGPMLAGYVFDVTGNYTRAFVPAIAVVLLAALAISLASVPLSKVTEVQPAETAA
ncbi:MAG: MFS transporter [Chloroflexi bacterium]|nr:MFS transporter [Chloroflexota bacterium]